MLALALLAPSLAGSALAAPELPSHPVAGTDVMLYDSGRAKSAGDAVSSARAALGNCDDSAFGAAIDRLEGLIASARAEDSGPGAVSTADFVVALTSRAYEDHNALKRVTSQLEQEWSDAQPCDPPPAINVTAGGFTGQLDRRATGMLGIEFGGVISANNLVFLDNDTDVNGYFLNGSVDTTNLDNQLWGDWFQIDPGTSFSTGFRAVRVESNTDEQIGLLPTGADTGLIFSPLGPAGGLGGGLSIPGRDFENLFYTNDYEFHQYSLEKKVTFNSGPVEFSPSVLFGYGGTEITERFSGQVTGINQNFAYHNMIDVDTFSVGAGLNVEFLLTRIGGVDVEYYGGVLFETQFHDQSGSSTLTLDGNVNAQETQNLGGSETTTSFEANAGLSFEFNNGLDLIVGGRVRSFDTPSVDILPQQAARIGWHNATEAIAYAAVKAGFGKKGR